jgi:predicted ATPase
VLRRFAVRGFKSLETIELALPRLTVLFGPNAAGKSNILDAIQTLSRIGTSRTFAEALREPIRGYPVEAFRFPPGGLPELLTGDTPEFSLEADMEIGRLRYRYRVGVTIQPRSGSLALADEYLATLSVRGEPNGTPTVEVVGRQVRIRRKSRPGRPRHEPLGVNSAYMADPRLAAPEYRPIEQVRAELSGWRTYYLDPRVAMRAAKPPSEVDDIGVLGENIAPFLYRLKAERPKHFDAVRRTLRSLVPSVEDLAVDLDKQRGTLDVRVRQDGIDFSSRIISEGTLRVLALCAMAANPWAGALLAFEEPENGVHPRRLELIADLLTSLAVEHKRQLIVTTHSLLFCDAVLRQALAKPGQIAMLNVRRTGGQTDVKPFDMTGPLFREQEIAQALTARNEDGLFESLVLRGLLDE